MPTLILERPPLNAAATGNVERSEMSGRTTGGLQKYRVIARRGLQLREGPGTEHDIIDTLPSGRIVTVVSMSGEWCQVDVEGDGLADGYCHSGFLAPVA